MLSRYDRYAFNEHKFSRYTSLKELMQADEFAVLYTESLTLEHVQAIRDELAQNNVFAFIIDEKRTIRNKGELLRAIEKAAEFPEWGFNWDALIDWLGSFHWHEADGFVMIYLNPQQLIVNHKADYDMLVDIMYIVSGRWRVDGVPFKLLTTLPPAVEKQM